MLGVKEYPYGISTKFEKYPGGGTAKYVLALSNELAKNGDKIHLVVRRMPGQKKIVTYKNLTVHRVFWINNKYLRLPSFSLLSFFKSLTFIKSIDVIHTHGSFDALYAFILAKLFNKKCISTPHGLTSLQAQKKYNKLTVFLTRTLEKWSFKKVDHTIFLSQAEKNTVLEELKLNLKSYQIINMGIIPQKMERFKTDRFNIIFIGRLVPVKGLDNLINSVCLLNKNILNNIRFIIVGDGFYRKELEMMVEKKQLKKNIKFAGFTNNINKYLSIASLFILPSNGGEGLPVAVLEAMSVGIPCMISNFESPFSKDSIITLDNNHPETIAEQISYYYQHPYLLNEISQKASQEFFNNYSIKKTAIKFKKAYEFILQD